MIRSHPIGTGAPRGRRRGRAAALLLPLLLGADALSTLRLSHDGRRLAFCRSYVAGDPAGDEICVLEIDGTGFRRLTDNPWRDRYPCWSPGDSLPAFLSWRAGDEDLDIYRMRADGSGQVRLHDSGGHDADVDWHGERIAFTCQSRIWLMNAACGGAEPLSDPPQAGQWGQADLPFGDYDPRFRPDGGALVCARLHDDACEHGNYDFVLLDLDGGEPENLRPPHCPAGFLFRSAVRDAGADEIFLVGEWWE